MRNLLPFSRPAECRMTPPSRVGFKKFSGCACAPPAGAAWKTGCVHCSPWSACWTSVTVVTLSGFEVTDQFQLFFLLPWCFRTVLSLCSQQSSLSWTWPHIAFIHDWFLLALVVGGVPAVGWWAPPDWGSSWVPQKHP